MEIELVNSFGRAFGHSDWRSISPAELQVMPLAARAAYLEDHLTVDDVTNWGSSPTLAHLNKLAQMVAIDPTRIELVDWPNPHTGQNQIHLSVCNCVFIKVDAQLLQQIDGNKIPASFEEWKERVDLLLLELVGISSRDVPGLNMVDTYWAKTPPIDAATWVFECFSEYYNMSLFVVLVD